MKFEPLRLGVSFCRAFPQNGAFPFVFLNHRKGVPSNEATPICALAGCPAFRCTEPKGSLSGKRCDPEAGTEMSVADRVEAGRESAADALKSVEYEAWNKRSSDQALGLEEAEGNLPKTKFGFPATKNGKSELPMVTLGGLSGGKMFLSPDKRGQWSCLPGAPPAHWGGAAASDSTSFRGTFQFHSFQGSFFSGNHPKTQGKQIRFLKRRIVEKNGNG